ncbi:hypothetical protein D0W43_07300 [Campylobacter coli]|uniref:hypothetical protein n=1 Tax=Campylobacter TaxID=194 RepID=UPI00069A41AB|nr:MULTISPECIES: hypothetical protein [Campylobacter]EAH7777643.1 hypothetical protein [Campylobacter coli]EAI2576022.1 hypothetical protein [Campylobacter coli]EAI5338656.1 hypothetical protein [Campylobacter coli]EAI5651937.1 hypothetical protein [Campylobacter jejuni]EAI6720458.1 hypothetical protein [Campylobacter coli]
MIDKFIESNQQEYDKILTCEQNVKLELRCNGEKFYKILIDTKDTNKIENKATRCDYLATTTDLKKIIIYIELKGEDIKQAIEQILTTRDFLNEKFEKRYAAITHTGNPEVKTILQKNISRFRKKNFKLPLFTSSGALRLKYDPNTQTISK